MKRTIFYVILGAALVVAAVGASGCQAREAAMQQVDETRSAVVERGTLLVAVSASGSIEPEGRVNLSFESPGEVVDAPVKVGDVVTAGDVLAQLDTGQLELQVQQAEAALALVEAQLTQLEAGARPEEVAAAEANLRAVESQVGAAAANRDQVLTGPAESQIAAAEAQVASMALQQRMALLAYDRTVAETENKDRRERAHHDLWLADQALAAAQAQVDELRGGADGNQVLASQANVEAAEAQRDAAQAQLDLALAGAAPEQLADVQAQVAQTRATLSLAQLALDRATLYAPFDGVVAVVNVTPGEMASGAQPAITLLNVSTFRMTVGVDEMDVGRLEIGQAAEVTLDSLSDVVITGKVERIAPAATIIGGVVYYNVIVALDPTDVPIRADMTANVTIVVEELADVLMISTWVVRVDDAGQTFVNQQLGEKVVRTDVELGVRHEGWAQVLDGLSEGDEAIWVQETGFGFRGQ